MREREEDDGLYSRRGANGSRYDSRFRPIRSKQLADVAKKHVMANAPAHYYMTSPALFLVILDDDDLNDPNTPSDGWDRSAAANARNHRGGLGGPWHLRAYD